ncbi:acyl-CoA dehydrogenase family protein [Erythrobacter sp. SCSIO 43205]|uniref:acyl-CoA dehydrogenase family protein n=1 Tax=Erythrobacter sp. SCSIO 43205 TaxID=2779361 RepID=UPI001CA96C08|nr:acyl-CoA dehydrogenase [Erythrobacter sp. SCSIO 43205]UAB77806.1 acyl-CoA dehydrogenase family protein [Erythrobacter sp. SCSIO 43205]
MDFSFSQEQEMLRESVAKLLTRKYDFDTRQALVASDAPWSADVWTDFAELGLTLLPFSEEHGGLGGSIADLVAFAGSLGEYLVVEPYVASTVLAGGALAESGTAEALEWVEKLGSGEAIVAFAYEEGNGTATSEQISMQVEVAGGQATLNGEKTLVIAGDDADALLVVARATDTGKLGFYLVEKGTSGLTTRPYKTIDGRAAATVRFDAVPATVLLEDAGDALDAILAKAIIVQCAEGLGAMKALLNLTSEYAMTRKQFGQPIGAFQVVAHRLADMKIAYTKALSTLTYTAALANSGAATPRDIATLKGQMGKLGREIGEAAIQTHGGVGMTDELSVSHYHKRILALDTAFGGYQYHLRRVGQMA